MLANDCQLQPGNCLRILTAARWLRLASGTKLIGWEGWAAAARDRLSPVDSLDDRGIMLDLSQHLQAHIDQRLREDLTIWLGSVRTNGHPHFVPVGFLWDGNTILIFSLPDTLKVRNIKSNNNVVLALDSHSGTDVVIIDGQASLVSDSSVTATTRPWVEKYGSAPRQVSSAPRRFSVEEWAARFSQPIRVTPLTITSWISKPDIQVPRTTLRLVR